MPPFDRPDNQSPDLFGQTPWQTVGPFFHYALPWRGGADLVGGSDMGARPDLVPADHDQPGAPVPTRASVGEPIAIFGRVIDGAGEAVPDAMIEIWQADGAGRYPDGGDPGANDRGFPGFGRAATGEDGIYRFRTLRPGATTGPSGAVHAPHIAIGVIGRGLIKRLVTRLYFADAPENETDPVLALVPAHRRETLVARKEPEGWRLDIVLQGEGETAFFDC